MALIRTRPARGARADRLLHQRQMRKNRSSGSLAATWKSSEDDLPRLEAVGAEGGKRQPEPVVRERGDGLPLGEGRLLLVTNRLPVSAERASSAPSSAPGSSGSLASMQREAGGVGARGGGGLRGTGSLGGSWGELGPRGAGGGGRRRPTRARAGSCGPARGV